ncbi:MAG TPA: hypothetical protein EYH40_02565 [Desulfurococcales archaeon]|nr:hypothetical protein [Desulfurococcales archaeon]
MYSWIERKRKFTERLMSDISKGIVDYDIMDILMFINSLDNYYTTSSCSGRIIVIETPEPGDKVGAVIHGKWHRRVTVDEVVKALSKSGLFDVWLVSQGPIIHIVAKNLEAANTILQLAVMAGFKHSGIISIKCDRVIVEVKGNERLDILLKRRGRLLYREDALPLLVDMANTILYLGKRKLFRFKELVKEYFEKRYTSV